MKTISTTNKKEKKQTKEAKEVNTNKQETQESQTKQKNLVQDLQEQLLRLQAEFANYKRRTDDERPGYVDIGVAKALKIFINVFDDFELALQNKADNVTDYKKGMELIFAKFISAAEELGVQKIQTTGEEFNPHKHEALLAETSEEKENTILQELQAGYMFKEQTLRSAKVKVAKK